MRLLPLHAFLIVALWLVPAQAQGFREAEMEFARGRLLFEMRDHTRAVESIMKAWRLVPENRYLPLLALSYKSLGDEEQALVYGELYLERQLQTPDEEVVRMVAELKDGFARGKGRVVLDLAPLGGNLKYKAANGGVGESVVDFGPVVRWFPAGDLIVTYSKEGFSPLELTLSVSTSEPLTARMDLARLSGKAEVRLNSNVAGARVRMDGVEVGTVPFKALVEGGDHLFQVWSQDHIEWTGVVDAVPGKVVEVSANLVRAQGTVPKFPRYDLAVEGDGGVSLSLFGWIVMGLGVGAGGAAGYFFYDMYAKNDESNTLYAKNPNDPQIAVLDQKVQDDWTYAIIGAGAAGGLVAGGLLMVLLDSDDEDEPAGMELLTLQPWSLPGGGGLDATWVF